LAQDAEGFAAASLKLPSTHAFTLGGTMTKTVVACMLAVFLATPVFAAGEKKVDKETCRRLAMEKYKVQDGRVLNKAIKPAVQRCMQGGPSAL